MPSVFPGKESSSSSSSTVEVQPTYFAVAAVALIFLSLIAASPWSIFRPHILKDGDVESDLIPLANPDLDSCHNFNPFWAKIKKEFDKSTNEKLRYPGNEAAPGLALLRNPALQLYHNSSEDSHASEKLPGASSPRFIYLIQAPGGLPPAMASVCGPNSTLIILSYIEDRADTLFVPKSSWTTGRNVLFAAALRLEQYQGWRFTYYVFMDDDAVLAAGSWRDFEQNFLVRYLPAMGTPFMHPYVLPRDGNFTRVTQPSIQELEAHWAQSHNTSTISSVYFFDAMVTAYHREAAVQLLPYITIWDADSWWISHLLQCHRGALLFHAHVLMYDAVRITNPEHRPYKRRLRGLHNAENAILQGALEYNNTAIRTCFRKWVAGCTWEGFGTVEEKSGSYDRVDYNTSSPCLGNAYGRCRKGRGN